MDEHDPRMSTRRGPDGPTDGGRIRRPTRGGRGDEARLERLSAYLDGWTTDRERSTVERELASDAAVREALDDLRMVRTALANLETPRAPRSFALVAAPPRRSPFTLFRRLEWATRGAAAVAALAFAVALVRAPQVSETVTSAAPVVAQESAAVVAPASTPPPATARETATQTLSAVPSPTTAGAATAAAAPALAPASIPAPASSTPAAAASPAAPAPANPDATPAAAPRALLAPAPTTTPAAASAAAPAPTPAPTVEATRFTPAPVPAPTLAAPVVTATPEPAPTPAVTSAKSADAVSPPPPAVTAMSGTMPPAAASDDAGETDVAPALGVLALLLVLLATIQRVGGPPHDGA